jgi:hypothetical protein
MKFDLKISQTGLVDWVFYAHHSPIWISLISTKLKLMISRYSDSLQAGRSGDQIPVGAKFSAPIQTGSGAQPASCTMGTGSFLGGKAARAWHWPPTPSSAKVK